MKKHPPLVGGLLLSLLLAGCQSLDSVIPESKKIEYKSAGKLPTLEVPPDLTQPTRDDRYAVPDISPRSSATFSEYTGERRAAPGTSAAGAPVVLPTMDKMRIERSGTQRWLVVNGTPDQLWPSIKEFWQETGFIVDKEIPEAGVMETDWAENRAKLPQDIIRSTLGKVFDSLYSTAERDKFRTRLEKGSEPGTTEIYISHRGMYEIYVNEGRTETKWQPRPAEPDLEAEMLRRLMVRLGVEESRSQTMIASGTQKADRAKLARSPDGAGTLTVQEPFDRAWRRVGLALDRVGFTVEDRDRAQGLYYVRYIDPEVDNRSKKDDGWLSKLAFWKGKPEVDPKAQYRIHVATAGNDSSVRILTREGGVDNSETARKILGLLYDQLK